ncbi:CPBP family intramembrane glutamic endopeptidase [Companilactobacillus nantensis]|uniref:CPBP family intramembrane glutamic endopeptidase n=1 Tax=Companilactobacillus nantensis TaxID=305793 RepID=UPI000708B95C|nr:CPBP family intramembrane glutamic endopeptidase [Companilactobacillus nantensis]GEO65227.1 hypothetical protein LNA01_24100 [Companilactobacillus nantensis]
MHKRKINVWQSLLIVALIYIVFSVIGGATGELLLHLNETNADYFRKILVSIGLLALLYYFYRNNNFGKQNIKWGFIAIAIVIGMALTLNNDFADFKFQLSFIYIAVTVGLIEEVIFRGLVFYFIDYLHLKSNRKVISQVYLSTVIFALAHVYNLVSTNQDITQTMIQVTYAFCLGSVFALCYAITKNIFFSVIAHGLADLLSAMIGGSGVETNVILNLNNVLGLMLLIVITVVVNYFAVKGILRNQD